MVDVEITQRSSIGFDKSVVASEQVSSLFFVHLDHGAFQLGQEIEDLSRLCRPLLILHFVVEDDLLFILERLEDLARLIQHRATECSGGQTGAGSAPFAKGRLRDLLDPMLGKVVCFRHTLALGGTLTN